MTTLPTSRFSSPRPLCRSLRRSLIAAVLGLSLLSPTAALASGKAVVADCVDDGRLSKKYPAGDYSDALKNIPTDVDEYTDCRDIIRRGQLGLGGSGAGSGGDGSGGAGSGGGGDGGTGGGGASGDNGLNSFDTALATATPEERASVDKLVSGNPTAVQIAGRDLRPDALSKGDLGSLNSLPAPLVIVLALLFLGGIAALVPTIRTFVRTRRQRTA